MEASNIYITLYFENASFDGFQEILK